MIDVLLIQSAICSLFTIFWAFTFADDFWGIIFLSDWGKGIGGKALTISVWWFFLWSIAFIPILILKAITV